MTKRHWFLRLKPSASKIMISIPHRRNLTFFWLVIYHIPHRWWKVRFHAERFKSWLHPYLIPRNFNVQLIFFHSSICYIDWASQTHLLNKTLTLYLSILLVFLNCIHSSFPFTGEEMKPSTCIQVIQIAVTRLNFYSSKDNTSSLLPW